jgi:hypothetical protein
VGLKTRSAQNFVENVGRPWEGFFDALSVALKILEIPCFALYVGRGFLEIKNWSKETTVNAEIVATLTNWRPSFALPVVKK